MREPHILLKNESSLDQTVNLKKVLGKSVLSKGGKIIGTISEVRLNPATLEIEGVLVRRSIFGRAIYIGRSYFSCLSQEAVILNIEVSILIKGKQVIDSEGRIIGRVKEVIRKGTKNDLDKLYAKSLFSQKFSIPESEIKSIGKSVILKPSYNANKKYFWQSDKSSNNL